MSVVTIHGLGRTGNRTGMYVIEAINIVYGRKGERTFRDTSFTDDLHSTEAQYRAFLSKLEGAFGFGIDPEAASGWENIGDVVDYINDEIDKRLHGALTVS